MLALNESAFFVHFINWIASIILLTNIPLALIAGMWLFLDGKWQVVLAAVGCFVLSKFILTFAMFFAGLLLVPFIRHIEKRNIDLKATFLSFLFMWVIVSIWGYCITTIGIRWGAELRVAPIPLIILCVILTGSPLSGTLRMKEAPFWSVYVLFTMFIELASLLSIVSWIFYFHTMRDIEFTSICSFSALGFLSVPVLSWMQHILEAPQVDTPQVSTMQVNTQQVNTTQETRNQNDWTNNPYVYLQKNCPVRTDCSKTQNEKNVIEEELEPCSNLHAEEQFLLGCIHYKKQSYEKAFSYFSESAKGQYAPAQNNIGIMYERGQYVQKDETKAVYWYRKAAENGSPDAQFNLAYSNYRGYEDNKNDIHCDEQQAVYWFTKAAEQGHAMAQYWLGNLYGDGVWVKRDVQAETYWYHKAADQGLVEAQSMLGLTYSDMYKKEKNEKHYTEAIYWYTKAAEQDDIVAQYRLAEMYADSEGSNKDYEQAIYWYSKAAEQGHYIASYTLGNMYYEGNVIEKNNQKAAYFFQKAAERGYVPAQYPLGKMYEDGIGVERNYKMAAYWYHEAAQMNNSDAQYRLGVMYENGLGVEKNSQTANYWYQKAKMEIETYVNYAPPKGKCTLTDGFCFTDSDIVGSLKKREITNGLLPESFH